MPNTNRILLAYIKGYISLLIYCVEYKDCNSNYYLFVKLIIILKTIENPLHGFGIKKDFGLQFFFLILRTLQFILTSIKLSKSKFPKFKMNLNLTFQVCLYADFKSE